MSLPVGIFQGYDRVLGEGRSTAVSGTSEPHGGESTVRYSVCLSIEELSEALEVDQSLTVGLLGIGSVSEKLKFVKSQKVTSTSVCIAVYSKHTESKETVTNVALKPDISIADLKEFCTEYGDSYLSSRTQGGEYYAVYLYSSVTREQQSELVTQMQAQGIFTEGTVDGNFGTNISNFNSSTKVTVTTDQSMSGILNPQFPLPENMIAFAINFPSIELTAPAITHFEVSGYERVPGFGSNFDPITQNCDLIVGEGASKLGELEALQNAISVVTDIYAFYGGYKLDAKLEQVRSEVNADMEAMEEMIGGYESDPTKTVVLPVLSSLDKGSPLLQYEVNKSKAYGGNGGDAYNDIGDINEYLYQKKRITALQLRTGLVVDQLNVSYNGQRFSYGHNGGDFYPEVALGQGIFVKSVGGYYGYVGGVELSNPAVTELTIELTSGVVVPGEGQSSDTKFQWSTVPENCFVLGFCGRSGDFLDQLQVVYASFKPAAWL